MKVRYVKTYEQFIEAYGTINEINLRKKKGVELTYGQAMSTQELDNKIKSHIRDNYPEDYNPGVSRWHGGGKVGMTGKQGHGLSVTHITKIAKFAKKNNDKELSNLIDQWIKVARENDLIESLNESFYPSTRIGAIRNQKDLDKFDNDPFIQRMYKQDRIMIEELDVSYDDEWQIFIDKKDKEVIKFLKKNYSKHLQIDNYLAKQLAESLNEGGNALTTTQRILNSDIPDTLVYIEGEILPRLGLEGWDIDCAVVGSAGKKKPEDTSGDIDIAVSIDRIAGQAGIDVGGVLKYIQNRLSEAGYETNIQYGFHQVNVAVPIAGDPQKGYCQVDLMVTDNLDWSKFIYYSPDYRKA